LYFSFGGRRLRRRPAFHTAAGNINAYQSNHKHYGDNYFKDLLSIRTNGQLLRILRSFFWFPDFSLHKIFYTGEDNLFSNGI
ncbi:MAG TPA: hypothetical protein PKZ70_08545, partial [Candidatus Atribacteria bacterium]|nr:hypothetical protein [Candidatus Atribacteria bacterium]